MGLIAKFDELTPMEVNYKIIKLYTEMLYTEVDISFDIETGEEFYGGVVYRAVYKTYALFDDGGIIKNPNIHELIEYERLIVCNIEQGFGDDEKQYLKIPTTRDMIENLPEEVYKKGIYELNKKELQKLIILKNEKERKYSIGKKPKAVTVYLEAIESIIEDFRNWCFINNLDDFLHDEKINALYNYCIIPEPIIELSEEKKKELKEMAEKSRVNLESAKHFIGIMKIMETIGNNESLATENYCKGNGREVDKNLTKSFNRNKNKVCEDVKCDIKGFKYFCEQIISRKP